MNQKIFDVILGTTSMIMIVMSLMVIFFISIALKQQKQYDARNIFKQWILFTGMAFIIAAIIFDVFGVKFMLAYGMNMEGIKLFRIYNNFISMLGVSFIFTWTLFFYVFDISDWMDKKIENFKPKNKIV